MVHEKAAEKARQAGIFVVMDRCILKEHRARDRADLAPDAHKHHAGIVAHSRPIGERSHVIDDAHR